MPNYPINNHLYTYFWNKYRPAILQLMKEAANGPQEYKFQQHEFKDINPKEKGGYAFTMEIFKGKSQIMGLKDNIKKWVVAQDLLLVLQKSAKAMELMETSVFRFTMDKQFVLSVTSEAPAEPEDEEEVVAEVATEESKEEAPTEVVAEEAAEETKEEVVAEEASVEDSEDVTNEEKTEEVEKEVKKPASKKEKEKVS